MLSVMHAEDEAERSPTQPGERSSAEISVGPPRVRRLATLAVAFAGSTIGLVIGIALHRPAVTSLFAVLTALPAASALGLALIASRNAAPVLRVAEDGLIHRSLGAIPWSEIHGMRTTTGPEGRTLHIEIADPTYMLSSRRPGFVRRSLPDYPSIEVSEAMIDMPLDDLREAISARLAK
jgi:hypothetical protein